MYTGLDGFTASHRGLEQVGHYALEQVHKERISEFYYLVGKMKHDGSFEHSRPGQFRNQEEERWEYYPSVYEVHEQGKREILDDLMLR